MGISLPMAILGGGALSAGSGIFGSIMGANAQEQAAQTAANTELSMYGQTRQDLMPFMQGGASAFSQLSALMGMKGPGAGASQLAALQNYPGYQFALQQGNRSLNQSLAARGIGLSGGQLRDAVGYNQGMANQLFGTYYNQLYGMSQLGANAAAGVGTAGMQAASGAGNAYMYGGNAAAAGYAGIANSFNGFLGNALGAYQMEQSGMYPGGSGWYSPGMPGYNAIYAGQGPEGISMSDMSQYGSSDRRLKTDIVRVGSTDSGLPVFTYRFKGSALPQMGVMAQDVARVAPHAVRTDPRTGYLRVNYREVSRLPPMRKAA